jgi:hypothetical protein
MPGWRSSTRWSNSATDSIAAVGAGDALAGDARCAAVDRLEDARVAAADVQVQAGREPDATGHRSGQVGQDAAERSTTG